MIDLTLSIAQGVALVFAAALSALIAARVIYPHRAGDKED